MLARPSLTEEGIKGVIRLADSLITWHLPIWLNAMLETVKLPAGIAHLAAGLTDMDGDDLAHGDQQRSAYRFSR